MKVKLIAETVYVGDGKSMYDYDIETVVEAVGRVSSGTVGKLGDSDPRDFVDRRLADGHVGLLEHAVFTFMVSGITRATATQIVRHRMGSYVQKSLRYTEHDGEFRCPQSIVDKGLYAMYYSSARGAFMIYESLLEAGVPKEDARMVLPLGTLTDIAITMNARSLLHFFDMRIAKDAQWEIRSLAKKMLVILSDEMRLFDDYLEKSKLENEDVWNGD